jgi:hypothetical protein
MGGLSPCFVAMGGAGPRWTEDRARAGSSPEHLLAADSGHGGLPRGRENEERASGVGF